MPDTSGLGSLGTIGTVLGGAEAAYGIVKNIVNTQKQNNLLAQRRAYQTPQEIYDVLNATENNASEGLDPTTLNYFSNQTNSAFAGSIGSAQRLGADPNTLSAIFGQNIDSIMKVGAENHRQNIQNFSQYLNALNSVASNKAAEQKSQQDILKDKLQATGLNLSNANSDISGGINNIFGALSADQTAKLYALKNNNNNTGTNLTTNAIFNSTGFDNGLTVDNTDQSPLLNNNNNTFG